MATNGIEILIDVLAQEAISSTDQFIRVLTDAAGKAGVLSGSIDELDGALASISKSGASADDMALQLVATLEDFGVQTKDAETLSAAFADTLKKMGVSGKEAASGVDLAAKSNEQFAGSADAAAAAAERESVSIKGVAVSVEELAAVQKSQRAIQVSTALAANTAVNDLGAGYAKLTTLSEMATPALMKAASWAGIGLAGLAYEGIKQYTQFNKLITQTITQAGVAPSKMGFLSGLAESVAKSTGQSLNDVANTIYRAASGTASWNNGLGSTKKQLSDIVTQVSKLNVVGGIATGAESEQASRVVTALINSNIRGVGNDPAKAAALVNAVVGSGDMRLSDLVPGIGRGLLSSAVANNMSAQDVLAWVATLTSQGTTASVAGNYVKTGINLLAHPSAQGVQALAMLGIKPGELENLASGPGGLVAELSTLKTAMQQLNPGNAAQFFYHEAGIPRPGGAGMQGAVAKLQTWSAGELSPKFISDWISNKLTSQEQTQATDLILTKAFGGSKQFATIAAVINNLGLVKGIEAHINSQNSVGYFNSQYARTAATPSQQFKMMQQSIVVDLVNIGKELTPLGLTVGHAVTGIIDGLSRFKVVLYGFVGIAASLLAFAGAAKVASIASGVSPFIGAAYNRLGLMAGKDSKFTTAMNKKANSGLFKFLNIYDTKKHGILSKLGGEAIAAGSNPMLATESIAAGTTIKGLSQGENALNTTMAKGVSLQEQVVTNTRIIADEMAKGNLGGGSRGGGSSGSGLASTGGRGGAVESAAQRDAAMATSTPYGSFYMGSGQTSSLAEGTIFKDPKTGRYTKVLANGRRTFVSKAEAFASGAMNGPLALGTGSAERYTASGSADTIALGAARAESNGVWADPYSSAPFEAKIAKNAEGSIGGTVVKDAMGNILPAAESGGLMSSLGGIMGGPIGMIGMMAAPMILGALTPAFSKLGSLIGGWFSGGPAKVFTAHINNPLDTVQASAQITSADAALHKYETEVKGKDGKLHWVKNYNAIVADNPGYAAALKADQLAHHTYTSSVANANNIGVSALQEIYGTGKKNLSYYAQMAQKYSGTFVTSAAARGAIGATRGVGTADQMKALINQLPSNSPLRASLTKMMKNNGVNWQDFSKIISTEKLNAQGVNADMLGSSAQWLDKHAGVDAALSQNGYFNISSNIDKINAGMKNTLSDKQLTSGQMAGMLPLDVHMYKAQLKANQEALKNKNLPSTAKTFFLAQEKSINDSINSTNKAIDTLNKVSKETTISGASVDKLAKENAAALAANGLTATMLADAIAKALSPYIKQSRVVGTNGPVSRTKTPAGAGGAG